MLKTLTSSAQIANVFGAFPFGKADSVKTGVVTLSIYTVVFNETLAIYVDTVNSMTLLIKPIKVDVSDR